MTDWHTARRILCIRLDNMGDVLMTTPAMQALKDAAPDRHLTLLTSRGAAALADHLPMVEAVWAWDAPWVKHAPTGSQTGLQMDGSASLPMWIERLDNGHFDAAVIFTVYSQSPLPAAMLSAMARIPLRLAHCRENPYAMLTDWVPETEPAKRPRHEVQRQLDLVRTVGATVASPADARMRFHVPERDRLALRKRLHPLDTRRRGEGKPANAPPCIVMHPGATAASRRWPAERFADVARALAQHAGAQVLVTGDASETELAERICAEADHERVIPVAGRLTLGQLGALIETADLLISNNTGPVHLAAALGTPVVVLYALTNPQHTPWHVPHRTLFADVPCRYCYKSVCPQRHHRCLLDVHPHAVLEAALALLDGAQPDGAEAMPWDEAPSGDAPKASNAEPADYGPQPRPGWWARTTHSR